MGAACTAEQNTVMKCVFFSLLLSLSVAMNPGIEQTMPCTPLDTCGMCAVSGKCGWCATSQKCLPGSDEGPDDGYGTCEDWNYSFCRDQACNVYTTCQSCVMDPFCGYCAGKGCMQGISSGPLAEDCDSAWANTHCDLNPEAAAAVQNLRFTTKGGDPLE